MVCAHYGLDESREVSRILEEVSRILVGGGRFVTVSRNEPTLRAWTYLDQLGFRREEVEQMIRDADLYPGPERLIELAAQKELALESEDRFSPPSSHERTVFVFRKLWRTRDALVKRGFEQGSHAIMNLEQEHQTCLWKRGCQRRGTPCSDSQTR